MITREQLVAAAEALRVVAPEATALKFDHVNEGTVREIAAALGMDAEESIFTESGSIPPWRCIRTPLGGSVVICADGAEVMVTAFATMNATDADLARAAEAPTEKRHEHATVTRWTNLGEAAP